ncbi:hypothetical protein CCS38_04760 [Streptomyces purpurogeneiscleroticus]|nr:hypothetical protein [Streptomyces purpurogeneiscleroticus]
MPRRWRVGACAVIVMSLAGGCASLDERRSAASEAARGFHRALSSTNGVAACGALAPGTREELIKESGTGCPRAVLEEQAALADRVRQVDVYGRQARVVLTGDTLFLARFRTGWKVTAAHCTLRPGQPYDCAVKGG